jgi:hypothetical protein
MKENKIHITLHKELNEFDINKVADKIKEELQKTFEPLKHKTVKQAETLIKKGLKNNLASPKWKVTIHNDSSR